MRCLGRQIERQEDDKNGKKANEGLSDEGTPVHGLCAGNRTAHPRVPTRKEVVAASLAFGGVPVKIRQPVAQRPWFMHGNMTGVEHVCAPGARLRSPVGRSRRCFPHGIRARQYHPVPEAEARLSHRGEVLLARTTGGLKGLRQDKGEQNYLRVLNSRLAAQGGLRVASG